MTCGDFEWMDDLKENHGKVDNSDLRDAIQSKGTHGNSVPSQNEANQVQLPDSMRIIHSGRSSQGNDCNLSDSSEGTLPAMLRPARPNGLDFLSDSAAVNIPSEIEPAPIVKKQFTPSKYQEDIRDFVLGSNQALRIEAYAGSGKTSTNAWVCGQIKPNSARVKVVVFAKTNQLDMAKKIPDWIPATTTHSSGFSDIRRAFGSRVKVDERKVRNLLKEEYEYNYEVRDNGAAISKLVSLCLNTMKEPTKENLDFLCERYNVTTNGDIESIYEATANLYHKDLQDHSTITFDDMLAFPALGLVPVQKCDLLFVDEYQDNNEAQKQYYLKTGARIVFVGDAFQAIYGFRGAMIGAMDEMQSILSAEKLPLPVSYRCAKSIVALAQTIVPGIIARDNAPEGIVKDIPSLSIVQPGDMVLCRNNAPLVKPCFELIRNGIKATIRGRDIGTGLVALVKKIEKKFRPMSFIETLSYLQSYTDSESAKLVATHKDAQAASLQDQAETIFALADGCHSLGDLERRIGTIFSDEVEGVVFSTVHKAKGLESDRIFVIEPQLLVPQKYDIQDWQMSQLRNLNYVAITRARNELYFVRG
jgi:DNA helicase II / ATP-dependent DNA helicase PcrA